MILGDFQFSLKTLSVGGMSVSTGYGWVEIERIEGLSFVQYLGMSNEIIVISGVLFPARLSNYASIEEFKRSSVCLQANNLIEDSGSIIGKFVVLSIKEERSFFDNKDRAKKTEFSMNLRRVPGEEKSFIKDGSSLKNFISLLPKGSLTW